MNEPQDLPDVVTSREAADLLMVDQRTVQRLAQAGYIQRNGLGRYVTTSVVQGYIRSLKEERKSKERISAENRVREARARQFEVQIDKRAEQLVEMKEFEELLDEVVGTLRDAMVGFSAGITKDRGMQLKIDDAVEDIFLRAATKKARAIRALRATGRAPRSL